MAKPARQPKDGHLSVEVCGFVLRVSVIIAWFCIMAVAYLPDSTLRQLGFTFYPDKYVSSRS